MSSDWLRSTEKADSLLRVVPDTNVYVSAFNFGGVPFEILTFAIRQEITLFISPAILQEVEGVLLRKFRWSAAEILETLTSVRGFARSVSPHEKIDLIKEDEPDNRILECAQAARAAVIVTGDRHLRQLGKFRDIAIMSPREFVNAYETLRHAAADSAD